MSLFFIQRPIFAWVIAIGIMLAGVLATRLLPVAQYPDVAPPQVQISTVYTGADAQTVENSVTQILEQQLQGLDNLLYFTSNSSNSGRVQVTATFDHGTNPDVAQVQVQNAIQAAITRLPQQVQLVGVRVAKSVADFLMILALHDATDRMTNVDISDYLVSNLQDPLSRVNGVGSVQVFGAQYAMRIWLDPHQLNSFQLTPADIQQAILAQNAQVSAGEVGGLPAPPGQQLNATVTAQSRLQTPDQFRAIIVKTETDGSQVRLQDVARVELGDESYGVLSRLSGHPAAGMAISLAPGADALTTSDAVKARVLELSANLPQGLVISYPRDSTEFIRLSVEQVVITLAEAIVLVLIVMFVFLQDWRATLVPAITIPAVLLGTFAVLAIAGLTINTLTLFGMVLAIGLLVDDAIVVVENIERVMREENLPPREATAKSMGEITGALVVIAVVLSAVYLPMAFFGGSTGVIYRQFSITIVSAMALSIFIALTLTPALCANFLQPPDREGEVHGRFFRWFNRTFETLRERYERVVRAALTRAWWVMGALAGIVALLALLFLRLPTGYLPEEDQGALIVLFQLPAGASQARTLAVGRELERYFLEEEQGTVAEMFTVIGFSFAGAGQNAGLGYLLLKDWNERSGAQSSAQAIAQRAMQNLGSRIRDAQIFALVPPAIQGLGQSGGFDMQLEDAGGLGRAQLNTALNQLLERAAKDSRLTAVRANTLPDTPQLHVNIDEGNATAHGLSLGDVNTTLSSAWGGLYVNDFIDRGRVKRVVMQADAPFRSKPEDLAQWFVRSGTGEMVPFSAFATTEWLTGPQQLQRFNGFPAVNVQGQAPPGASSGDAMKAMEEIVATLPRGIASAWTGLSYQERESSGQAPLLYALSVLVIFLCLAALYESWSVPISVLLVIPLGIVGAVIAATLRGLANDIYFQVGLLTTMGLSAKNAILIVEFAEAAVKRGDNLVAASVEGARLRLRPIVMTSLAFMAGVAPLTVATGPGAASQHAIGTGVIGGMLTATVLAIFFVPVFYVVVKSLSARLRRNRTQQPQPT
jgi:multidrug efflux pump